MPTNDELERVFTKLRTKHDPKILRFASQITTLRYALANFGVPAKLGTYSTLDEMTHYYLAAKQMPADAFAMAMHDLEQASVTLTALLHLDACD